ncbi:hypothetical protein SAMN04487897_10984 [Paenibacillus sp. yr247]|nr:hypothetical protein SAMN04487897_10984 [Paenibacillus sp. yr247]
MRDLTRYRRKLIRDATAEKNRIHKILQDANLKLITYRGNTSEAVIRGKMKPFLQKNPITAMVLGFF